MIANGIVPNAGTLGNGTTNGNSPIKLDIQIPTNGVPPGAATFIYCSGAGGILRRERANSTTAPSPVPAASPTKPGSIGAGAAPSTPS